MSTITIDAPSEYIKEVLLKIKPDLNYDKNAKAFANVGSPILKDTLRFIRSYDKD